MLKLLLGRAGSGKSTLVLRRMQQNGGQRRQILLVPEQASYEAERRLCQVCGNGAGRYAEVLSFTRLENRVLARTGGLAEETLDAGGRILLMYAALKAVSAGLTVFAGSARKPEFLTSLLSTVDELKSYCVSADALTEAARQIDGMEGDKLRDLALIYGAYEALTARGKLDPRDRLTRLADKLKSGAYAKGADVYLDGFTDFTPQQGLVIQQLLRLADTITVTLTCDHLQEDEDSMGVFSPARRTAATLLRLAQEAGVQAETETLAAPQCCRAPELDYLEGHLFGEEKAAYDGKAEGRVQVYAASDCRQEVEWTAGMILELLREKGFRCRDIAVTARRMDRYHDLIESIFESCGIPVFQSSMTDILDKPVFTLILSALDIVNGNYAYEDVFRYLKTGLTNFSQEDCDLLENYVLTWKIRGGKWTSEKGWTQHPLGYGKPFTEKENKELEHLNSLRKHFTSMINQLKTNKNKTIEGQAKTLYTYLEQTDFPQKLAERTKRFLEEGEPELAQEYEQLWDIFCGAMEQCAALLGEMPCDLEEFTRLLRLLLSQYTVGSIPASLDRVITGEMPRLVNRPVKVLFLLGADDQMIPQLSPGQGLLMDRDRELLSGLGLELAPRVEEKLYRERTIVYNACAQPAEYLCVSWPAATEDGSELRPSFLMQRLLQLFPTCGKPAKEKDLTLFSPCMARTGQLPALRNLLRELPEYRRLTEQLDRAEKRERGTLSSPAVKALYGRRVPMSASRMDRYQACHFAYFMQYGLKAKARTPAGFQAPEYGIFVHFVLEFILRAAKEKGGVKACSLEEIRQFTQEAVRHFAVRELGGLEHQTPRFRYLFQRLQKTVDSVVDNVVQELKSSDFQPIFFELGFGHQEKLPPIIVKDNNITLSISGFVDRVDGWGKDGRIYLRVVDYKTGRKSFDFTDAWNGIGLQMLLYLFALEETGERLLDGPVTPAGVLYLPAREAVISGSRSISEEERQREVDQELTRNGLLLSDTEVLEAMEHSADGSIRFLPIKINAKTGKISGDSLVSDQQLGMLKAHIQKILTEICREMAAGNISADPYWRGPSRNACLYCDYAAACQFEDGCGGDRRRWQPNFKTSEFWSALEEQEKGGDAHGGAENS